MILFRDGRIERYVDHPLEEYLVTIRDAKVAWIDCSTRDGNREIERIAQITKFSKIPIQKLSTGFYSAYEDYDTELGIMLPSVVINRETMKVHPLYVLIWDNLIVIVYDEEINRRLRFSRYATQFFKRIATDEISDQINPILERIIDENNGRNFEYLLEIEMHCDEISKQNPRQVRDAFQ